jgi:hypothetical protein
MNGAHFKCIGECVSRGVVKHIFHNKVLGLSITKLERATLIILLYIF